MADPIRQFRCPACGGNMTLTASHQQHAQLRDQYARCNNPRCGLSVLIRWEVVKIVSPPAPVFAPRVRHLPPMADQDRLIDLAHDFVGRIWAQPLNRDQKMAEAADYLQRCLPTLSRATAELEAARAIADYDSAGLKGWHIEPDHATSTSITVRDAADNQHVITLREQVTLIARRRHQPENPV